MRIKRHLDDAGATYQKGSVEAADDKRLSTSGSTDVPFAEAPDLADRNALRAVVGSFSRMTVIGVPVAAAADTSASLAVVVDAATVQRYGESIALIAQLEGEQVMVRLPAARDLLGSLDQSLQAEQSKFNELADRQAKTQGKADELEEGAWYPGKFLMGKKKQEDKVSFKGGHQGGSKSIYYCVQRLCYCIAINAIPLNCPASQRVHMCVMGAEWSPFILFAPTT